MIKSNTEIVKLKVIIKEVSDKKAIRLSKISNDNKFVIKIKS